MSDERMFPVLVGSDQREYQRLGMPREVPWRLLAPHEAMAKTNHDQTLERLAERGGLSPSEMRLIVEGRRWKGEALMKAQQEFEWITAWLRAYAVGLRHAAEIVRMGDEGGADSATCRSIAHVLEATADGIRR